MWITISIVVFFTILIVISFYSTRMVTSADKAKTWPPTINKCPDYWEFTDLNGCVPRQVDNVYLNRPKAECTKIDPYILVGGTLKTDLTTKAQQCGIVWDGINNSYSSTT